MNAEAREREPRVFVQAILLVVAGSLLGLLSDLCLPGGAIAQRAVVMRDLMAQVPVRLYTPEEATRLLLEGEVLILDARAKEQSERQRPLDAIALPLELIDRYQEELIERFTGRRVLVLLEAERSEEARELAARLVSGYSAERGSTIQGGWEALREAEGMIFEEGPYELDVAEGREGGS